MNRRYFLMSTAVMAGSAAIRGLASPNDTVRMAVVGAEAGAEVMSTHGPACRTSKSSRCATSTKPTSPKS
jgi:hypothetical protein